MLRSGHEITLGLLTGKEKIHFEDTQTGVIDPIREAPLTEDERRKIYCLFQHVYFIHPEIVRKTPIKHPDFVRYAKYKTPNKEDKVAPNNVKARDAFTQYTRVNLNSATNTNNPRLYGYTVAHIYGKPDDPLFFTAGYNLALTLDSVAKFSDPQYTDDLFYWALTSAANLLHKDAIADVKRLNPDMEIGIYYRPGELTDLAFPFWFKLNTLRPKQKRCNGEAFYEVIQVHV